MSRRKHKPRSADSAPGESNHGTQSRSVPGVLEGKSPYQIEPQSTQGIKELVVKPNTYRSYIREYTADVYESQFFTAQPAVVEMESGAGYQFANNAGGVRTAFQGGGVSGTFDASVSTLGSAFVNVYPMIVRDLFIHRKIALRDTTLVDGGTNIAVAVWLTHYANAFSILKGMNDAMNSGYLGNSMEKIASAIGQNYPLLESLYRRLCTFSVPPMFIRYLSRMTGVKVKERTKIVYLTGLNAGTAASMTDLTISANIASRLAQADLHLTLLLNGDTSFTAADARAICNTFAIAYGSPEMPKKFGPSFDLIEYAMVETCSVSYNDTTAVKLFSWPNTNVGANKVVPILVPVGYDGNAEAIAQYFSLFRQNIATNESTAGTATAIVANLFGSIGNIVLNTSGTEIGVYSPPGTFSLVPNTAAGVTTLSYASQLAILEWAPPIDHEDTTYATDVRVRDDYDEIFTPLAWLVDETQFAIEKMFLEPIRS